MSENKRLHPAAIIFNFIKTLKEAIFPAVAGFVAFDDDTMLYFILVSAVILILLITFSILSWYRYTYRIEEGELRIEYGIFVRKKRYISKNRIQSIDLTEGIIHRLFKLVQVQIETASSGNGAEASLKAVKLSEGKRLRDALKTQYKEIEAGESVVAIEKPIAKISSRRLFIAGTTSGSVGVIFALFAFLYSEMDQFIPDDFYDNAYHYFIRLSIIIIVGLVLIGLLVLWVIGIAGTMIKYGNFTITKNEDELFITRGLLEKRQLTIPLKRIQAIGIDENLIRQPFGYATIYAEVAGGSLKKGEDFSAVLFPILKKGEIDDFLREFLPDYVSERDQLNPLPKQAKKFYVLRSIWPVFLVGAGITYFLPQFSWIPIVLLFAGGYLGFLRHRDTGFRIDRGQLTIRFRRINRSTVVVFHRRIQAFEKRQHRIQEKQEMATTRLSICSTLGSGTHYKLKDLGNKHVNEIADWYSYR